MKKLLPLAMLMIVASFISSASPTKASITTVVPAAIAHNKDFYTKDNSDGQRDEGVGTKDKTNDGAKK